MPSPKSTPPAFKSKTSTSDSSTSPAKSKAKLFCCAGNSEKRKSRTGTALKKGSLDASPSTNASNGQEEATKTSSRFSVLSSQFSALGSQFSVLSSRFSVLGSQSLVSELSFISAKSVVCLSQID